MNKVAHVEDLQLPSCQMAMVVLASESAVGTGVPSGISWLWNHDAPGDNHAIMAGIMVEATELQCMCWHGTSRVLLGSMCKKRSW